MSGKGRKVFGLVVTLAFLLVPLSVFAGEADSEVQAVIEEQADSDVISNNASGIPDPVFYQKALQAADANNDGVLTKGEAKNVSTLDLAWDSETNKIQSLKGIEFFENLTDLWVNENALTNIDQVSGLTNLSFLYAYDNELTAIPNLQNLGNLVNLDLSSNKINNVSAFEVYGGGLTSLRHLFLDGNPITSFKGINSLSNLEYLHMNKCQLTNLAGIETMNKLLELYVDKNKLTSLSGVENLVQLERLMAADNQLKTLPDLKKLIKLQGFDPNNYNPSFPGGKFLSSDFAGNSLTESEFRSKLPAQLINDAPWLEYEINNQQGSTKPLTSVEAFVARLYDQFMGRNYDKDGLDYWTGQLMSGEKTGAGIADDFIFSKEFEMQKNSNEVFVNRLYQTFFDREPDAGGKAYWMNFLDKGATRRSIVSEFVNSMEFGMVCKSYGINQGQMSLNRPADLNKELTMYVYRCYVETLGRVADDEGLNYWTGLILKGEASPKDVAESILFSKEFEMQNVSDDGYVDVLYRTFMGREADLEGYNYWMGQFKTGMSRYEMFGEFSSSKEFQMILVGFGL